MKTPSGSAPEAIPHITPSKMARGMAAFLALTFLGLGALWHFTARGDTREIVAGLSIGFLALAALSAVADLVIGAFRYQIFLRRIRPGTSFWLPIRADLANRFVGAVTPSQTGGGPAQVFILWRGGIPVPDALSFLLINFLSTVVFFLITGGVAAWIFRQHFPDGGMLVLIRYGFVAFAACLAVMLVGLLRPEWLARPMAGLATRLEGSPGTAARMARRVALALSRSVDRYRSVCTYLVRDNPSLPVMSFLLTGLLYLNKFTLAWLVMRGLGAEGGYVITLAVQALLHFILFVAPSPGGSGIAEISTGALMSIVMPLHLLAPFTLAYRFFLLYLPAAAGSVVLLRELGPTAPSTVRDGAPVLGRRKRSGVAAAVVAIMVMGGGPAGAQSTTGIAEVKALVVRGILAGDREAAELSFRSAVERARNCVAEEPQDPNSHYALAVALGYHLERQGLRKQFAMAAEVRREAERTLELDPDHPGAHHVLGRLHAGAMRLNRMARLILREVAGASVLEGASWTRAEHHFRRAWEEDPSSPRHAMELGALYLDTDRPELARVVLLEATRVPPREMSDSLATARAWTLLARMGP